ncbi:hypothetical protein [Sporosarcina ureae]|uniref:hypothetical protein n=1 Tax=Sporosarcina ureae TaxID=1571 RepID=UPI0012F4BC67|nr:hypothetical protein [Sporosarcina ureae]
MSVMVMGCTKEEVLRVGAPFIDDGGEGIKFHSDLSDSASIGTLREIMNDEKKVEKPRDLREVADTFFSLDKPKESIAEISRYVWYQDDASAILYNEGSDIYSDLPAEQTNELKRILEQ